MAIRYDATRGVGGSLKLGEQKGGLLWRAREREPVTGGLEAEPPVGVQGAEPPLEVRAAKPPETGGIFVLHGHTFLRCPGACSGSRSDRSD